MKRFWENWLGRLEQIEESPLKMAMALLVMCFLGYGLLLPALGIYTDDWTFLWVFDRMGSTGLHDYFTVNRPFWGLVYQVSMPLLGHEPLVLHVYGLVWRWLLTFAFWGLLRVVWPQSKRQAFWAALVFLLYPGFALQYISLCTGNMWLVYTCFITSLLLTGLALRSPQRFWVYNIPALFLSLANILMMEYFLPLELTRLLVVYFILREDRRPFWRRLGITFRYWLPFGLILAIVVAWRAFFFGNQTYTYPLLLIQHLRANPLDGLLYLAQTIPADLFKTTFGAWGRLISAPIEFLPSGMILVAYVAVVLAGIGLCAVLLVRRTGDLGTGRQRWAWQALVFGGLSMLTAGWPFWLTELTVQPYYFNSRFTMPFMLGSSIFLVGLLELIPWRMIRSTILAVALGGAMGVHLLIANDFRLDWIANQRLIQQVYTRVPMLTPGTTILFDQFEIPYTSTATFTAQLNLLYPPTPGIRTSYGVHVARMVEGWENPTPNTPIRVYLIIEIFWGRVGQSILANFPKDNAELMPPPNCLWLMEPNFLALSPSLDRMQDYSDLQLVGVNKGDWTPDPFYIRVFGLDNIPQTDCIAFERADLARQQKNWARVVEIGDQLQTKNSKILRRIYASVFIYGYGMAENWETAERLNNDLMETFPGYRGRLCEVWDLIRNDAPASAKKDATLERVRAQWCVTP